MERLTKLPVLGPALDWFWRTRLWRLYTYLDARHWTRLAAAITFTSFTALFPTLAVGAALGAALLSDAQMQRVEHVLAEQVPGISQQLELGGIAEHAATVGVVAGAALLLTGVGWVGSLRESLRACWDLPESPGNVVVRKAVDLGTLLGLGLLVLLSIGSSAFALTAVHWVAQQLGLAEGGIGTVLLRVAAYAAAVGADFVLLVYVLTLLPGVRPPRRGVLLAALQGAVGFELLKLCLGGYLAQVAAKSVYGAFGTPIALLVWINFMAKLLLYCAAWSATERDAPVRDATVGALHETAGPGADAGDAGTGAAPARPDAAAGAGHGGGSATERPAGTGDERPPPTPGPTGPQPSHRSDGPRGARPKG